MLFCAVRGKGPIGDPSGPRLSRLLTRDCRSGRKSREKGLSGCSHSSGESPLPPDAAHTQRPSQNSPPGPGTGARCHTEPIAGHGHKSLSQSQVFATALTWLCPAALCLTPPSRADEPESSCSAARGRDKPLPSLATASCLNTDIESSEAANPQPYSPRCLAGRLTVKSGGSLECGWNPFCRQEEISCRPCSVSLKNPVLEQTHTQSNV